MTKKETSQSCTELSDVEELILSILLKNPAIRGLVLINKSNGGLKRGTVYVYLSRLVEKGFVEASFDGEDSKEWISNGKLGAQPRRIYKITANGEKALKAEQLAKEVRQLILAGKKVNLQWS